MFLKKWEDLPGEFQNDEVRPYYQILRKKRFSLFLKRVFDIFVALILLIILSPLYIILALAIKFDSNGPVFFRQVRVTKYNKEFKIFKFRTMVDNAEKLGSQVTQKADSRITKVGSKIRKYRLDETCQVINVLLGDMSFVGTRPEVPKYTKHYTNEMMATLLLPAGVTSEASILYKDEEKILENYKEDVDRGYIEVVLPQKMKINLNSIKTFSFLKDIKTMFKTVVKL